MYLHLGQDVVVAVSEVVAIVDLAAIQRRGFQLADVVGQARERGQVVHLAEGPGTSLVITTRGLYVSSISPLTLRRRALIPWSADGAAPLRASAHRRVRRRRASRREPSF